jgi:hypothetical protein
MVEPREKVPQVTVELEGMKLRFLQIESWVIHDLSYWTQEEIERESEETLKELGITRQPNESYLHAWMRAMLEENGRENNPENRRLVLPAIRQDKRMFPFVWAMGREEAKQFGLDDSPAIEEYRAMRAADQALIAGLVRAADHRQDRPLNPLLVAIMIALGPTNVLIVFVWILLRRSQAGLWDYLGLGLVIVLLGLVLAWRGGWSWRGLRRQSINRKDGEGQSSLHHEQDPE